MSTPARCIAVVMSSKSDTHRRLHVEQHLLENVVVRGIHDCHGGIVWLAVGAVVFIINGVTGRGLPDFSEKREDSSDDAESARISAGVTCSVRPCDFVRDT
ncbi:MAG: hypothetical protein WAL26_10770 [Mycobacterium sp.]